MEVMYSPFEKQEFDKFLQNVTAPFIALCAFYIKQ